MRVAKEEEVASQKEIAEQNNLYLSKKFAIFVAHIYMNANNSSAYMISSRHYLMHQRGQQQLFYWVLYEIENKKKKYTASR